MSKNAQSILDQVRSSSDEGPKRHKVSPHQLNSVDAPCLRHKRSSESVFNKESRKKQRRIESGTYGRQALSDSDSTDSTDSAGSSSDMEIIFERDKVLVISYAHEFSPEEFSPEEFSPDSTGAILTTLQGGGTPKQVRRKPTGTPEHVRGSRHAYRIYDGIGVQSMDGYQRFSVFTSETKKRPSHSKVSKVAPSKEEILKKLPPYTKSQKAYEGFITREDLQTSAHRPSQIKDMDGVRPKDYARAFNLPIGLFATYHYAHLRAWILGGAQSRSNFVLVASPSNTYQVPFEKNIKAILLDETTKAEDVYFKVTADLKPFQASDGTTYYTDIAEKMTLKYAPRYKDPVTQAVCEAPMKEIVFDALSHEYGAKGMCSALTYAATHKR